MKYQTWSQNPDMEEPEKSYVIVSLDVLSGLVQGMGELMGPVIDTSQPPFMDLLIMCLQYPQPAVQQSAYALIGDMAIWCFSTLKPYLPRIMPELIAQIQNEPKAEYVSVCNNAAWSIGEVVMQYGPDPEFAHYVQPLMHNLVPILLHPKSPKSLTENAAVTIGRLGYVFPELVAPHLDVFAKPWCEALGDIKDNAEKDSAFKGFCALIITNSSGIMNSIAEFFIAIAKWQSPSHELNDQFLHIINGLRTMAGPQWDQFIAQLPEAARTQLKQRYNV